MVTIFGFLMPFTFLHALVSQKPAFTLRYLRANAWKSQSLHKSLLTPLY